jgi:hypothetical protein
VAWSILPQSSRSWNRKAYRPSYRLFDVLYLELWCVCVCVRAWLRLLCFACNFDCSAPKSSFFLFISCFAVSWTTMCVCVHGYCYFCDSYVCSLVAMLDSPSIQCCPHLWHPGLLSAHTIMESGVQRAAGIYGERIILSKWGVANSLLGG